MKRLIVDTDFSGDVGDLGAVALACAAHRRGLVDVLGFVIDSSYAYSPGACRAVAQYFGLSGQIFGAWKGAAIDDTIATELWVQSVYNTFPHDGVGLASSVDNAVDVYRFLLSSEPDGSVEIASIGFLNVLSDLLDSMPDDISRMSGAALVAAKVRRLWVMGGDYAGGAAEWNFKGGATPRVDITTASQNVCANWPSPVRFVGFETGTFVAGGTFGRNTSTDLIAHAYDFANYPSGRTAWDECLMLACVQDGAGFSQTFGANSVNTGTGVNTWARLGTGKDAFLTKGVSDTRLRAAIDGYVGADASADPFFTGWGTEGFIRIAAA